MTLVQEKVQSLRKNPRAYAYDQNPNMPVAQGEALPNTAVHMQNLPNQHFHPDQGTFAPTGYHHKIIDHNSPL